MKWLSPPRPITSMLLKPGLNNQSSLVRSAATGNIWSLYPLPRFLSLVSRTAHSLGLLPSLVVPSQGPLPDLLMLQGVPRFSSYSSVLYPHSHDPRWSHVFSLSCHHRKMAPSAVITAQPSFLNSRFRNLSAYLTSPSECLIRFVYLTYPNWAPNTSRPQPTPPPSQTTAAKQTHTQKPETKNPTLQISTSQSMGTPSFQFLSLLLSSAPTPPYAHLKSVSKIYWLYLQNISRLSPLLHASTVTTLVQATIVSYLDCWKAS